MLIAVANPKEGSGKSTCAINLACALADLDSSAIDRWQGKHSVVLVDADVEGTVTRCCSGGHLPVSSDHGPTEDPKDIDQWIRRMQAVSVGVDYVVIDGPSHIGPVLKAIVSISDLVIVPCSVSPADAAKMLPMIELIREARSTRSDGGPSCLLTPTGVESATAAEREIEDALRRLDEPVGPAIHRAAEFGNAFTAGQWVGDFAPDSTAYRDIRALRASVEKAVAQVIGASGPREDRPDMTVMEHTPK
jgi:chromosome partitioning protein